MTKSLAYFVTLLRRDFVSYCNQRLSDIGLSQGQLYFILYIGKHPDCSPKELTQALKIDAGHTNRSLTKLKQAGFLTQLVSPHDRRVHILRLTEKGQKTYHFSHELLIQWEEKVICSLSSNEQTLLISLMKKLDHLEGGKTDV